MSKQPKTKKDTKQIVKRKDPIDYLCSLEQYIEENVKLFMTEISFSNEYHNMIDNEYIDKKINYILVEGETDYKFFKNTKFKKFNNRNYYIFIKTIINFAKDKECQFEPNCKHLIEKMVKFKLLCKLFKNNELFGIVDRDFGDEYPNLSVTTQHILSNDTHDLETMLISTDKEIYKKLPFALNLENYLNALYMSYQIGCVKYAIWEIKTFVQYNKKHNFKHYFKNGELNIYEYISYLTNGNIEQVDLVYPKIIQLLRKDNKLDSRNKFIEYDIFKNNIPNDIWFIINGHDFTDALNFLLHTFYSRDDLSKMLINSYDINMFKNTRLFEKMEKYNLVKR